MPLSHDDSNLTPAGGLLLSVGRRDVRRAATRPSGWRSTCFSAALGIRDATAGTTTAANRGGRGRHRAGNCQSSGGQHRFSDR